MTKFDCVRQAMSELSREELEIITVGYLLSYQAVSNKLLDVLGCERAALNVTVTGPDGMDKEYGESISEGTMKFSERVEKLRRDSLRSN